MDKTKIIAIDPTGRLVLFIGVDTAAEKIGVSNQDILDAIEGKREDVNGWKLNKVN
jgi:hypothetical protein